MDDEETVRTTLVKMLEKLGYSVTGFKDGREVLDFFRSKTGAKPNWTAMIFDLTVQGGMGGIETVKELRKLDSTIPLFVASGYADDAVMKNPASFGFVASICKPFTMEELALMLEKHLRRKQ
jgi:CheY-like chemotaxis protein